MTRSFSNARTRERQRGYVLIAAIALAILYFGLMELMLMESQRTLREAQRFRAKVVATTLAENAAELAAEHICVDFGATVDYTNSDGKMEGTMIRDSSAAKKKSEFEIRVKGTSSGVPTTSENLIMFGSVEGEHIEITYAYHTYDKLQLKGLKGGL